MPKFFYTILDKNKKKVRGFEEANSEDELIARLQSRDLVVISVMPEAKEEAKAAGPLLPAKGIRLRFKRNRVAGDDLVLFCRQLATLLGAGVTILKSLEIISQQVASRRLHNILRDLQRNMEQGLSLHEAMAKHPQVFSELWVNLVESGEAGGSLAVVLSRLASYLERNAAFKRRIISALIYPCILMVAGFSALLFLTIKIIPTFSELFKSFGVKLPLLTQMIMNASAFIRKYMLVMVGLGIAGFYFFRAYTRSGDGRQQFERFKFKLPVFGEFFRALVVERFSSNMATLLESGVPILYSLEITEHSVDNLVMSDIIRQVKEDVRSGKSLSQPLDKSGFFEPMVVQMLAIGEEIGELSPMLKKINTFYQEYVETFLVRFTSMFEPIMLIFMGLVIGMMVVGMFLPIFQISQIGGAGAR
jgi:type II secretory pathway component PulF